MSAPIVHTVSTVMAANGVPFTVRYVAQGDQYGRNDCLLHDDPRPMIEFYDARYEHHTGRGQFVSRYYLDSLQDHPAAIGLMLHGGEPQWSVDAVTLNHVLNWATFVRLALAQQAIAEAFAGAA